MIKKKTMSLMVILAALLCVSTSSLAQEVDTTQPYNTFTVSNSTKYSYFVSQVSPILGGVVHFTTNTLNPGQTMTFTLPQTCDPNNLTQPGCSFNISYSATASSGYFQAGPLQFGNNLGYAMVGIDLADLPEMSFGCSGNSCPVPVPVNP